MGAMSHSYPAKSNYAQSIAKHISNNCWIRCLSWKVSMKVWRLPMSDARQNNTIHIVQYGFPVFRLFWYLGADFCMQISWSYRWKHIPTSKQNTQHLLNILFRELQQLVQTESQPICLSLSFSF